VNKLYSVFIVLLLSAFVVGCNPVSTLPDISETNEFKKEDFRKGIVKIRSNNRKGTGFIVGIYPDEVYIVTVSHVVGADSTPTVEFFENKESDAKTISVEEPENGLALLLVKENIPSDVIRLYVDKKAKFNVGDEVFTFGFPRGGARWAYSALSYAGQKERNITFSGSDIAEGNSGSPLIKDNQVVGIITSTTQFAFATSAPSIIEFLRGAGGEKIADDMEKVTNITTWMTKNKNWLDESKQQKEIERLTSKNKDKIQKGFVDDNRILNGTVVAFATEPGGQALDNYNNDDNGLYTKYLLKAMQLPNLRIEDALKQVHHAVKDASQGEQIPWYHAAFSGNFCFSDCLEHSLLQKSINKSALVIGNANYQHNPLYAPINDASAIAKVLRKRGFDVTLTVNLSSHKMDKTISEFINRLSAKKGVGLFYFSGHGTQLKEGHYLFPIDNSERSMG
jgi:hypothetical protein